MDSSAAASQASGTVVDLAVAEPSLSTLVAALKAADLVTTLQGAGPFTVFAPTNDAFAALPAGVVDHLLLPCNVDALTKVLTYHVVSGALTTAGGGSGSVATLEGQKVDLAGSGSSATVNGANVTMADVMASNGVVQVIDQVLLPPDVDVASIKATC